MKTDPSSSLAKIQKLFKHLKSDLLADSFAYLSRKDLVQVELVSRKFQRIVQGSSTARHVFTQMAVGNWEFGDFAMYTMSRVAVFQFTFSPVFIINIAPTQGSEPRIYLRHKKTPEDGDAKFTYAEFVELAGRSNQSFTRVCVASVAITYSALNSGAWEALKLTKCALEGCALKFAYKRGDFNNQTTLVKYLDYVLLPFFDQCCSLILIGPLMASQPGDLRLLKCSALRDLPTLALHLGMEEIYAGTLMPLDHLENPTPVITVDEIVEWLEGWKVPKEMDWSRVDERCLYLRRGSYVGVPQDLITKLSESFTNASTHRARYRLILEPLDSPNAQPMQWEKSNDETAETLQLVMKEATPDKDPRALPIYGMSHSILTRGPNETPCPP